MTDKEEVVTLKDAIEQIKTAVTFTSGETLPPLPDPWLFLLESKR